MERKISEVYKKIKQRCDLSRVLQIVFHFINFYNANCGCDKITGAVCNSQVERWLL